MNNDKYYIVKTLDLARALVFTTGERYFIFNDVNAPEMKVYSFRNTEKLQKALGKLNELRNELHIKRI